MQTQEFKASQFKTDKLEKSPNRNKIAPSEKLDHIHQKFTEYGKNAKEWLRKCALLLPEIEKYKIWKKKHFSSIYEYAAKLANMSQYQVNEALRTMRKTSDFPELRKIIGIKGINAVRPVLTIVNKETEHFWAEKAKDMSQHTLDTYVKDYKTKYGLGAQSAQSGNLQNELQQLTITMQLDPEIMQKLEKLKGQGDWNDLMKKFIKMYEQNLEKGKPPVKEKASRHIPQNIKEYVLLRSNGQCEFPGCQKKYQHLHHTNRFNSNHTHDPDKIVALCKAHHDLAHKSLFDNEEKYAQHWKIRKEPDLSNLNRYVDEQLEFYRRK